MNHTFPEPREVLSILATYWRRWLAPAVIVGILAAVYAVVTPPTWQASQALILRNEAANAETGPGKFTRTEDMKSLQETMLELVKSRGVLAAALTAVGPAETSAGNDAWPTDSDIDDLRGNLKLLAPKGAEFGATEVFYLEVRDHDRARAVRLNQAICDQLQTRVQQLRDAKAQSMIEELEKTVNLAKADLAATTKELTDLEKRVGSDLGELRMLLNASSSEGGTRHIVGEIENELRQARSAEKANEQMLALLLAAEDDPGRLLAAPNRLLESEPALKRLKDGLVDAQIHTANLQGRMAAAHPLVQGAKEAENEIGRHLHDELAIAIRGLEAERKMNAGRAALLEEQLAKANGRLGRLAEVRADYANQVSEAAHRAKLVEKAEQSLAEARGTRASAAAANLIARIDNADTGLRPIGPGRSLVALMGLVTGLVVGLGIVLLTVQPEKSAILVETGDSSLGRDDRASAHSRPMRPAVSANGKLSLKEALKRVAGNVAVEG